MEILITLTIFGAAIALFWRFGICDFILDELWLMEGLQKHFVKGRAAQVSGWRGMRARMHDMRSLVMWTYRTDIFAHAVRTQDSISLSRPMMRIRSFAYHGVFCVLAFALLRGLDTSMGAAVAGAAAVLVHPMTTPAVIPISGRSSIMCGIFYLAAILAPMAFGWSGAGWILALIVLGYKSKEEILFWPLGALAVWWFY